MSVLNAANLENISGALKRHVLIFLLLSGMIVHGQKKVELGLSLKPSISWLKPNTDAVENDGSRFGFTYGLVSNFNFGENYALGTGVDITTMGGKLMMNNLVDSTYQRQSISYRLQYIEIPIVLRMRTKEIGYMVYYGQFGFTTGFNIGATAEYDPAGRGQTGDVDIQDEIALMNLALNLGLGFQYNLSGTTNFVVGIHFHNGFLDILTNKIPDFTNPLDPGEKNINANQNRLGLTLGVLF